MQKSRGSGVRRALEYDPDAKFTNGNSKDGEITHAANEFLITIPRKSNQATENNDPATDPASLQNGEPTDQVHHGSDQAGLKTDPATDPAIQHTEKPILKLSKKQQDIRNYCSVPRNRQEILKRASVSDHFDNRKKYIYDLVEAGILERTIPGTPNDPNQKYRRKR